MLKHPLDTSKTKKYSKWLFKIEPLVEQNILKSVFERYLTHIDSKRVNPDIYNYATFDDFRKAVEYAEMDKRYSLRGQQELYDVLVDNNDVILYNMHSHDAARKIGLKHFSFRFKDSKYDCAWCTSFSSKAHFNYYYYSKDTSLYYLLIKTNHIYKAIAFLVYPDGMITASDEHDNNIDSNSINDIIYHFNLSNYIIHRYSDKKYELYLKIKHHLNKNIYFTNIIDRYIEQGKPLQYNKELHRILKRVFGLDGFKTKCYLYGCGINNTLK